MTDRDLYSDFFNDTDQVKDYAAAPPQFLPGFDGVHRMICVLLSQHVPEAGRILVHGAGGGLELESFARHNPTWTFLGVDPAEPMLEEARRRLGSFNNRVDLHHGMIDDAPEHPCDAATSILTLHFLDAAERQNTVADIVQRLKPGAPFIAVHCSFPQAEKDIWLSRHRDYSIAAGMAPKMAEQGCKDIETTLPVLSPEDDIQILRAAGLQDVTLFYSAFTWRGWIGTKK